MFPGPRPFAWPPALVQAPSPGPSPQFVFIGPGPQFIFTSPGPHLVFTGRGTKFVFTGPVYPRFVFAGSGRGLSLHIPTLFPQFVFTSPGLRFVRTQVAKLIYPQ